MQGVLLGMQSTIQVALHAVVAKKLPYLKNKILSDDIKAEAPSNPGLRRGRFREYATRSATYNFLWAIQCSSQC